MKKISILLLAFSLSFSPALLSQVIIRDVKAKQHFSQIPQEKIFIHYNSSVVFAGEYIYYKVYCIDSETNKLSEISRIAYVELVGGDGKRIFKHKIELENGLGQSDFFVQASVPSGNYKLLGYTQWMKNGEKNNFFRADVAIINPYRGDQKAVTPNLDTINSSENSKAATSVFYKESPVADKKDENLELKTNGKEFGKRQQVSLRLTNAEGTSAPGVFSISVRKIAALQIPLRYNSKNFQSLYKGYGVYSKSDQDTVFLPEARGNLLSGQIKVKKEFEDISVRNKKIAISIPGEDFVYKITSTNENGAFYFNLKGDYPGTNVLLQVIGQNKEKYEITINPDPSVDISEIEFNTFFITPMMEEMIVERSIHNQIENAYYQVKPDTIKVPDKRDLFYGKKPEFYDLGAYTRFANLKETFTEIIKSSWIPKNKKGEPVFKVRNLEGATNYNLPPLVLVDGVMVQDHKNIIEYPVINIQKIGILRDNYFLGPHIFQGIISMKTVEGDFGKTILPDYITDIELVVPQPKKTYFHQTYPDSTQIKLSRIPDFRYQLLWKPGLKITSKETNIQFYTSDVSGDFEILVEGFNEKGEPFSGREVIRVK